VAPRNLTGYKRAVEFHTKPLAKLPVVCESAPYPGDWRLECNPLFNSAFHNMQPLGCILSRGLIKTQPFGCIVAGDGSCVEAIRWA
jgi:hypothetical protein